MRVTHLLVELRHLSLQGLPGLLFLLHALVQRLLLILHLPQLGLQRQLLACLLLRGFLAVRQLRLQGAHSLCQLDGLGVRLLQQGVGLRRQKVMGLGDSRQFLSKTSNLQTWKDQMCQRQTVLLWAAVKMLVKPCFVTDRVPRSPRQRCTQSLMIKPSKNKKLTKGERGGIENRTAPMLLKLAKLQYLSYAITLDSKSTILVQSQTLGQH